MGEQIYNSNLRGSKYIATKILPCMGTIIGSVNDSTVQSIGAVECTLDPGSLPERTGTIFNRHYPRERIGGVSNGMIGYASNTSIS